MEDNEKERKQYGDCLMCGKELRKLTRTEDWDGRKYHVTCWSQLIKDIRHFDKVCYTKYNYKRLVDGKTIEEHRNSEDPIVVTFD